MDEEQVLELLTYKKDISVITVHIGALDHETVSRHSIKEYLKNNNRAFNSRPKAKFMKKDKIYIVGAGAIGKALAVFLQYAKKDVTLIRGSVDNLPAEVNQITVTNHENKVFQQKISTTTFCSSSSGRKGC